MKKTTTKSSRALRGSKATPRPLATASTARATSRRPSVFPAHLQSTPEEWRAIKRGEWLEVTQALDRYLYGSAFAPGSAPLYHLGRLSRQITEALQGDWIAW